MGKKLEEGKFFSGPKIMVIGVGGAGGNAVANMIAGGLDGVEFAVFNTDAQVLKASPAEHKIQLGPNRTKGLGAGGMPEVGKIAAEESEEEIRNLISGQNMIFVTAGMGGGTGTGAAPVVAKIAREQDILVVGVVTKPFSFEGSRRMAAAESGIKNLQESVDTLIIVPNDNLFRVTNNQTTFSEAFKICDDVLFSGIQAVTDLMVIPGLINCDFADIRAVLGGIPGKRAIMSSGEAAGENRAMNAAITAISNPLIESIPLEKAKSVLINISGDVTLAEVSEAVSHVSQKIRSEANITIGSSFDPKLKGDNPNEGRIKVSVIATSSGEDDETAEVGEQISQDGNIMKAKKTSLFDGIFGKNDPIVAPEQINIAKEEVAEEKITTKHDEDVEQYSKSIFDIPAFLRRKY